MRPKVLFVATVAGHIKAFHLPYLQWFQDQGYETHVVTGDDGDLPYVDRHHVIPMTRSPLSIANMKAVGQLVLLMKREEYALLHCHTPVGGVVARLAAVLARTNTKVIYTAHGFHFFRGAPLLNWLVFFPIEFLLSAFTDMLITINAEDDATARRMRFPARSKRRVHGIGVDCGKFKPVSSHCRTQLRGAKRLPSGDRLIVSVAEFNQNKNQQLLIRALAELSERFDDVKLVLVGDGPLRDECEVLAARWGVADKVLFLGYRDDVHEILPLCDIGVSASYREGLPVNIIEALSSGLPVVASKVRGHVDLIKKGKNGLLVKLGSGAEERYARAIERVLRQDSAKLRRMCRKSVEPFGLSSVMKQMVEVYDSVLPR